MASPRCIHMDEHGTRCRNKAIQRTGNLYACSRHATLFRLLFVSDLYSEETRHMLAYAAWNTADEGQALIDRRVRA